MYSFAGELMSISGYAGVTKDGSSSEFRFHLVIFYVILTQEQLFLRFAGLKFSTLSTF